MLIDMTKEKSIELNSQVSDYLSAVEDDALPKDDLKEWKNDLIREISKYEDNTNLILNNMLYFLSIT